MHPYIMLTTCLDASDIVNYKTFVAIQAFSCCFAFVNPWSFSGENLWSCDLAILNSQVSHDPPHIHRPHLYYPPQPHALPAFNVCVLSAPAPVISCSLLWNSASASISIHRIPIPFFRVDGSDTSHVLVYLYWISVAFPLLLFWYSSSIFSLINTGSI